jgi:hypothetical protein
MRAILFFVSLLLAAHPFAVQAQRGAQPEGRGQAPAGRGNATDAPFDPAGYWVSIVSDEWRYRMITPPKGNLDYIPVNAEGRRAAQAWDPAVDEANGEQCKGYGAGGIMRLPSRLHITWQDANTLKVEIDTGTQTRLLHVGGSVPDATEPSWQGYSTAQWEYAAVGRGAPPPQPGQRRAGQLKITTTKLRPGYLRKNGVPYGSNAVQTEYWLRVLDDDGTEYLAVTTMLEDSQYLLQPWIRTSQFRKQADAKGWNPTPCSAK